MPEVSMNLASEHLRSLALERFPDLERRQA
jgi:hypothetical protein